MRCLLHRNLKRGNKKLARSRRASAVALPIVMPIVIFVALAMGLGPVASEAAARQTASKTQTAPAVPQPPANSDDPAAAVSEMLATACRQDRTKFSDFLTTANATFYRQLVIPQQVALLRRLVLMQDAGRALLSTDANGRTVLRCESPAFTGEIHVGVPRIEQNLAYVPIEVKPDRKIEFGLVLNNGGWKLISIGLLVFDLPQLQPEWEAQEMEDREAGIIAALRKVASAIDTYQNAFEKLPETLAQLGPAPKEGISPDAASLLDADLITGHASGYTIRYRVLPTGPYGKDTQYELAATPDEYGKTGRRSFFLNYTGKLRGADKGGAPATAGDPVIQDSSSEN